MVLVDEIYKLIVGFPKEERFNLSSQLARCAVSIPKEKYEILEDKIQQLQKMISGFQVGLNSQS